MDVCLFLTATARENGPAASPSTSSSASFSALSKLAGTLPGLKRMVLHTPVAQGAQDPYLKDEAPPCAALQFYFGELGEVEAALEPDGALQALLDSERFALPPDCVLTQQVMAVRRFAVPEPRVDMQGGSRCTYLVSYEGPAEDFNAWLGHYVAHHPELMAQFPGIREIEIYTGLDYHSELPVARATPMQRNKVVFDSPEALNAALASPTRHAMREDFKRFPPFSGANLHFPMLSTYWLASR